MPLCFQIVPQHLFTAMCLLSPLQVYLNPFQKVHCFIKEKTYKLTRNKKIKCHPGCQKLDCFSSLSSQWVSVSNKKYRHPRKKPRPLNSGLKTKTNQPFNSGVVMAGQVWEVIRKRSLVINICSCGLVFSCLSSGPAGQSLCRRHLWPFPLGPRQGSHAGQEPLPQHLPHRRR